MSETHVTSMDIHDFPLWETMHDARSVFFFSLDITARCNNNRRHCYINLPAGDREAMAAELTMREIGHIADQAVQLGAM